MNSYDKYEVKNRNYYTTTNKHKTVSSNIRNTSNPKIAVSKLNLHYGDFHALKDISMNIMSNQITAFIGPSGCGKSTFLKSLNRMNDLVEGCRIDGSVLLDGDNIYGNIDVNSLRQRVGMVFQSPNPFPISVYDNITYGPKTHGMNLLNLFIKNQMMVNRQPTFLWLLNILNVLEIMQQIFLNGLFSLLQESMTVFLKNILE